MNDHLTEAQIDEIEKQALQPYRQITLPTTHVRQMIDEIRELRNTVCELQLRADGSKAIVDAVVDAAGRDIHTKISEITIPRSSGPPFHLIEALRISKDVP